MRKCKETKENVSFASQVWKDSTGTLQLTQSHTLFLECFIGCHGVHASLKSLHQVSAMYLVQTRLYNLCLFSCRSGEERECTERWSERGAGNQEPEGATGCSEGDQCRFISHV